MDWKNDEFLNVSATISLERCLASIYPKTTSLHDSCVLCPASCYLPQLLLASRLTMTAMVLDLYYSINLFSIFHPTINHTMFNFYHIFALTFRETAVHRSIKKKLFRVYAHAMLQTHGCFSAHFVCP